MITVANSNFAVRPGTTALRHLPASNTAAILTLTGTGTGPGSATVIQGIAWSYDAAPTGGNLKIENASGTIIFSIDITAAGPGFLPFPWKSSNGNPLIVTLAAGGSGVTGKVNVISTFNE